MERRPATTEEIGTEPLDERPTPRRQRARRWGQRAEARGQRPEAPTAALPTGHDDRTRALRDDRYGQDGEYGYAHEDETRALRDHGHAPGRDLVLGRYRLERRLGAGGFGVVWLAFDENLQREVAVKVVQREGDEPVPARAEREARVAARLNHPGIVALYELAADDDAVYLVSELVPGRTLAELSRAGAVSDRDVARIGIALCDALAHAHQRKVIHRDVKPQNVIVVSEPAAGAGFAKLADFGVAHLASGDPLTRTGDVVGTLAYMAPEQAEGLGVTAAADVYALALTLYEAWTGENPVRAGSPMGTARRLGTVLPPLGSRRRDLPAELCNVIDAALDPLPERRPPLRALRSALASVAGGLSDEGGLVAPGALERLGLTRTRRIGPAIAPRGRLPRLLGRLGAAAAAGSLLGAGAYLAGAPPHVSAVTIGAAGALVVALLPRIGWLACAAALCGWLAIPNTGLPGAALVVGVAAVIVPPLLLRGGLLWSVPALAPLLGLAGIGPVFLAVAGLPATIWRRAGLAAAGFVWFALAEVADGRTLLFGPPNGAQPLHDWQGHFGAAASHALKPLITTPALLPAVAWAALALLMPVLVRGRSLGRDIAGACVWGAGVIAAHDGLGRVLSHSGGASSPHGLWAGTILAVVAAVAATGAGLRRGRFGPARLP